MLTVKTLGNFSVTVGETVVSESTSRSSKVWKIFKYLITYRHKMVPIETLIDVLWSDDEPENPQKSLYTLMSRLRKVLSVRGEDSLHILFTHNCYRWNPDVKMDLDVAEFEETLKRAWDSKSDDEKLNMLRRATEIYVGDYLSESAFEMWAMPIASHLKRLYLRAVRELSEIYIRMGQHEDNAVLLRRAIAIEPFEEAIHERLIHVYCLDGQTSMARKAYNRFVEKHINEIGLPPSEEFCASCENLWKNKKATMGFDMIKTRLDAVKPHDTAFFCSSDTFDQIYQIDKRADRRMKFPVFLALITIEDLKMPIATESMRRAMLSMRYCLLETLRRGDVVSQYSQNQFLVMLSARRVEDAETALKRVENQYNAKYSVVPCRLCLNLEALGMTS